MHTDKPTPMTDAERQRKHRLKRQRELQALRAVVPATPQERESVAQVQRLAAQLDKATRTAAALQARIDAMQLGQGELQQLREALRSLIPKLTPAAQQVARRHLEGCGAAQWLAPEEPPQPAAALPSTLSSRVFFLTPVHKEQTMTETEARKAFNTASNELQTALAKYQGARTELHRITGEFVAADQALSLRFSGACAGLPSTDNAGTSKPTALADC